MGFSWTMSIGHVIGSISLFVCGEGNFFAFKRQSLIFDGRTHLFEANYPLCVHVRLCILEFYVCSSVTQLEEADGSAYCGRGHYGGRGRGAPKPNQPPTPLRSRSTPTYPPYPWYYHTPNHPPPCFGLIGFWLPFLLSVVHSICNQFC